ncbi:hypothetical protein Fuma_04131 [Fuerstiella marisgermanici]|uniref:Uncharacterized protein n=1 Tax=Fuerstiella marisgermanici TaxID=1891926 RepID=A0A1P8WKB0_9PLAN|nr:hypothetical protein Fuma_04131 [Fuerstiella marisgermanici]
MSHEAETNPERGTVGLVRRLAIFACLLVSCGLAIR